MTIDAWPSELPTGVVCFYPIGGGRSGGAGFMSPPAAGASTYGPRWTARLDRLPLLKRDTLLAARALQTRLEAGAKPIMLEACPGSLSPQVQGGAAMEAVVGADVVAGADELQILLAGDFHALRGGEHFSADHDDADVGRRLYRVVELVDNADPAAVTVRIVPRLRSDLAADAVLDFIVPSCPMRLVDGFDLPTEHGRFSGVEAMFEEWFDASPVTQTAGLRDLTLVPATILEASAEDTFVGRLFGATSGSTLTLVDDAGGRFKYFDDAGTPKIVAGAVATDFSTATSHDITVRETLAGRSNSPHDTVLTIAVTEIVVSGPTPHRFWEIEIVSNGGHASQMGLNQVEFAVAAGGVDASAGGTVYVVGGGADIAGSEVDKAFDGNSANNWLRNGVTGNVRIGKDYGVDPAGWPGFADARVTTHGANVTLGARSFALRWSDDGVTYTTLASRDIGYTQVFGNARSVLETDPTDGTYRCHRLFITDNNGGITDTIGELEFIGSGGDTLPAGTENGVLGRAIYSANNSGSYPASNAWDNSLATLWLTGLGQVANQFIGLIYPAPLAITQMNATTATAGDADPTHRAPKNVKRQVSHDNITWTIVATATWTAWGIGATKSV